MALTWPLNARVTQNFGTNPNSIQPNGHTGIDFGTPVGTNVRAAGPGTVVFSDWATKLSANNIWWIAPAYAGICVVIDHGNGILSLYAHLNTAIYNAGQKVAQGQVIGTSGNTGLSTGPHLHFELLGWPLQPYNGFYGRVNPNNRISAHWSETISPAGNITKPNQRRVGPDNVNQRKLPATAAEVVRVISGNTIEEFSEYIYAEDVKGINLWYKDSLGYAWAGGFTEQKTDGMTDVTPKVRPAAKANERYAGVDNINQRTEPNVSAPVVRVIAAKTLESFTGFVHGESIDGNSVWYKDIHGYSWSGGFENPTTDGLTDLSPKPVVSNERIVGDKSVNQRKSPNTNAEVVRVIAAGTKEVFTQYTVGEKISDIDLWYKDDTGYVWSGGFTEQKLDGLSRFDLTIEPPPVVVDPEPPVIEPEPEEPPVIVEPAKTLSGIDISGHQKGINLSTITSDFFIIKATEGVGWTDPEFATNVTKARATGKLIGFYHFARPIAQIGNTALAEADTFLKAIQPHLRQGDILVLDWEAENQNNTTWAKKWLDTVASATKSSPLIYMNLSTANTYNWTDVKAKYKLWLAQYPSNQNQGYGPIGQYGNVPGWFVAMWQYTSSGHLDTWNGNLDLNVFYGTKEDWLTLGVTADVIIAPPIVDPEPDPDPEPPVIDPEPPVIEPDPDPKPVSDKELLMSLLEKAVDEYIANKNP